MPDMRSMRSTEQRKIRPLFHHSLSQDLGHSLAFAMPVGVMTSTASTYCSIFAAALAAAAALRRGSGISSEWASSCAILV